MRLEQFFEKFELFVDVPEAVGRMRELVLQLAVQGRLVAQSSNDQPTDTLAIKISQDRAAFVKERNLARQRIFAPVCDDQRPFDLASGWLWTRLGNLCRVQAGFAFASSAFIQGDSGVPMIRIRDITKDRTQVNYVGEYREEFLVYAGDYLVGMDGNFKVAKWRGPRALLNQRVSRLQWYSEHLEPSFFAIALQHRLSELQGAKAYTTVDHLSSGQIENVVVPLPPLAEQKRIVAKVDELMALCDRLEAQQQEREMRHAALARASLARFAEAPTPANLKLLFHPSYTIPPADLRKTILTLAVQGKLVSQDPSDESGELLLRAINAERLAAVKARHIKAMIPLPSVGEDELSFDLPSGWAPARLIELVMQIQTGPFGSSLHKSDYQLGGTPVINPASINDGKIEPIDEMAIGHATLKRLNVFKLSAGDIVMARRGEMGRCAIVTKREEGWLCGTGSLVLRMPRSLYAPYLAMLISSPMTREYLGDASVGTTMQNLNQAILAKMPTGVPPLPEQRRIVAKVDQLMALVDQLEAQLATARTQGAALLDAAIHEVLHPKTEVVDLASYRAAIGCYAIARLHAQPTFGRVAAMKVLYLAETHVGLPMHFRPIRHTAGPYDEWIKHFTEQATQAGWFQETMRTLASGHSKYEYRPGPALAEQTAHAERLLTPVQRRELDRLLDLFAGKTTEEAEIIATLFAAWNDFLIDGHTPSDDEIVEEVREHWHESKQRFTPERLQQSLAWLRQHELIPSGRAPSTRTQRRHADH